MNIDLSDTNTIFNQDHVYLWYNREGDNSYMGCGITNPTLTRKAGPSGKFRIIPVDGSRHDEKHCSVAIQSVKTGKYLSCRRASIATRFNSAFAEFRKKRGHFETFTMIVLPEDGCVIFKSHNSLFLAINDTFHSCEFKSCRSRDEFGMPEKGRWTIIAKPDGRVGIRNTAASIARSFGATGQLAWGIIWFFVDPLGALQEAGTFVPRLGSE